MDDTVRTHGSRESFDADVRWRGENLSYSNGYLNPVAASIHGWMESPGHRRNLLDPEYKVTAIGAWIARANKRTSEVVLVFDCCSSGRLYSVPW